MRNKRIGLDCDGVLSDFVTPALEVINKAVKTDFKHEHVTDFNICEALGVPHAWETLRHACGQPGFVSKMQPIKHSQESVSALRGHADVYVITSPMSVPNWAHERSNWLEEVFGFKKSSVVQTEAKYLVELDVFIDDKIENVEKWAFHHPEGLGIIFDATYNKYYKPEVSNISRAFGWAEIVTMCQSHLKR